MGIGFLLALVVTLLIAASVPYTAFNTNQFNASGSQVSIKSGALLTNAFNNGVAIGTGGGVTFADLVLTNNVGVIHPVGLGSPATGAANGTNSMYFASTNPATLTEQAAFVIDYRPLHQPDSGPLAIWFSGGAYASLSQNKALNLGGLAPGETVGSMMANGGGLNINYGGVGCTFPNYDGATNVGLAGTTVSFGVAGTYMPGYFAHSTDGSQQIIGESSILTGDSMDSGFPLLTLRSNRISKVIQVLETKTTNATPLDVAGIGSFFAGVATLSSDATNAITATGVTNTASIDRQAFVTATATAFTVNDRSGAVIYTSPTLTATLNIRLQPGWSVRAASGLVGTVIP